MGHSMLSDLVTESGNKYADIVFEGVPGSDIVGFVDSGSYAFNALLSGSIFGGYANNKISTLAGPSSTGKTFFALSAVKSFLDTNPEGIVFYYDTENAITKKICEERHIDTKRMVILAISTVEEFKTQTARVLDKYSTLKKEDKKPLLIVLDSLGMLSTSKEMKDTVSGKEVRDMTRAQLVKASFRVLTLKAGRSGVPIIVTNHTYETQGSFFSQIVMGGGSGLQYAGSSIVFLGKRKKKDSNLIQTGVLVRCTLNKSRITKENSQVSVSIDFSSGLNRYYGLQEIALATGVFKKVGSKIQITEELAVFEKALFDHPEKFYTEDILEKIDAAAQKLYLYGSTFERMDIDDECEDDTTEGAAA